MKQDLLDICRELLLQAYDDPDDHWRVVTPMTPDGSLRRFHRLRSRSGKTAVSITAPTDDADGLREASATWQIGRHLFRAGVPVPEIYGHDSRQGIILCEDLGDTRLHDLVIANGFNEDVVALYRQAVHVLAHMQVHGSEGFNRAWCWDTPQYDQSLMRERESGYFLHALCHDFLDLQFDEQQIQEECADIAARAVAAPGDYFLHRDYQSRNLMVSKGRVRIIDFQGGRFGPLAYDLASLLLDPYAALPETLQESLFEEYHAALSSHIRYVREQLAAEYLLLAISRNLQILGAFAFLSTQRKRPFFGQFIGPALLSLQSLLAKPGAAEYCGLRNLAEQCRLQYEKHL